MEKWTGLKWVNKNRAPEAFDTIRFDAYSNVQRDLFYELPNYIYKEDEDSLINDFIDIKRKQKWLIDENGDSPYFSEPLEAPDYW